MKRRESHRRIAALRRICLGPRQEQPGRSRRSHSENIAGNINGRIDIPAIWPWRQAARQAVIWHWSDASETKASFEEQTDQ